MITEEQRQSLILGQLRQILEARVAQLKEGQGSTEISEEILIERMLDDHGQLLATAHYTTRLEIHYIKEKNY